MPTTNGTFTLAGERAVPGTTIRAEQLNAPLEDISVAINGTVNRDGTRPMQADLPMAGRKVTGLGDATNPQDAVAFGQVSGLTTSGLVFIFGGSTAPSGFLLCNGAAVSRATYAPLFAVIGTTYGAGNGSTTFNVPNLQGRVPVGVGGGYGLGATGGAATVTLTEAQMPAHNHTFSGTTSASGTHSHLSGTEALRNDYGGGTAVGNRTLPSGEIQAIRNAATSESGNHTHTFSGTTGNKGSGAAHNNMQPYIVLNYIIKV